jgi:aspartate/methionine/tyrosine aminotransferase
MEGAGQARAQTDTWEEIAYLLFQFLLQRAILNPPPSLDPKASPQVSAVTFNKAYAASGIRTGLSQAEEDDILAHIRQLHGHLRSAPDQLGPELQATTLATLRAMYIEYGGDPDDLGG